MRSIQLLQNTVSSEADLRLSQKSCKSVHFFRDMKQQPFTFKQRFYQSIILLQFFQGSPNYHCQTVEYRNDGWATCYACVILEALRVCCFSAQRRYDTCWREKWLFMQIRLQIMCRYFQVHLRQSDDFDHSWAEWICQNKIVSLQ